MSGEGTSGQAFVGAAGSRETGRFLGIPLIIVFLLLLVLFAYMAYRLRVLDGPGATLAVVMGVVIVFATHAGWVVLLFLFAAGGSLVSMVGRERKLRHVGDDAGRLNRGWRNVLGNGGAATAVAAFGFTMSEHGLAFPFAVAVAVAAADTAASELGSLSRRTVLVTRPSMAVPAGTNGGVSWAGTGAGVAAAAVVALAAVWLLPVDWMWVSWIVVAGALGSLLDSLLGALWERSPQRPEGVLSKTQVNLIATGALTLCAFFFQWLLF